MNKPTKIQLRAAKLACEQVVLKYEMGIPCKDYTPSEQAQRVRNARKTIKDIEKRLSTGKLQ